LELELRFGRGHALAKIHSRLPIAPTSGPAPQFACVGFCLGLPELRARAVAEQASNVVADRSKVGRYLDAT